MTGALNLPANGLNVGSGQLVASGGKVGIGTANPAEALHIRSTGEAGAFVESTSASSDARLTLGAGGNFWYLHKYAPSGDFQIYRSGGLGGEQPAAPRIRLPNANNNVLLALSGGNVGVGWTTPPEALSVSGKTYLYGGMTGLGGPPNPTLTVQGAGDWSAGRLVDLKAPWTVYYTDRFFIIGSDGNGSTKFYIRGDGAYWSSSSQRLKTDIVTVQHPLDVLGAINGVYFRWKQSSASSREAGFIAEQLATALPEAVDKDRTHVNYSAVIPVLVEGVKEMHQIVKAQETALAAKDRQIESLGHRLAALEKTVQALAGQQPGGSR
jgi:hypothetical protein